MVRENVGPEESEHEEELQQGKNWDCASDIVTISFKSSLRYFFFNFHLRWSLARGDRQSAGQAKSSSDQGGGGDGTLRSKATKNEQPRL